MVSQISFPLKRIYLHFDTVTQGFNAIDAHFEISEIIAANANGEQNYIHPSSYEGNFPKGDGSFTPSYVIYASGWRLVPYDQVSHEVKLPVEMLSYDGIKDRQLFDRSTVSPTVFIDITPTYEKVEIREVATGGLTTNQSTMLMELWQRQGLDINNIVQITDSLIKTGTIEVQIVQVGNTTELRRL